MLLWLLALAIGVALAGVQYGRPEGGATAVALRPAALRAAAVAIVAAALLDAPLRPARTPRPIIALDASASWLRGETDSTWAAIRARARAAPGDSLLLFGDSVRAGNPPTLPSDHGSSSRALVDRAVAQGRPVRIFTDGELSDGDALAGLPRGSEIVVPPRTPRRDAAVVMLEAPRIAVGGDTLDVRVAVRAGALPLPRVQVALLFGDRPLASAGIDGLEAWGERTLTIRVVPPGAEGASLLRAVTTVEGDAEPRNDTLSAAIDLSRAATAVFVSTSPDQDARFALTVLRGALALPTRAYLRVAPAEWRREGTLVRAPEAEVRDAFRDAPLAILHGDTAVFGAPRRVTRGALALMVPQRVADGDWYAVAAPPSPIAVRLPFDSLAPLDVSPHLPPGDWIGLETARGRRAERRPAIAGVERPRRVVTIAASGLWRWRFRGGAGSGAYAALWGGIFDWLAAERRDVRAAVPEESAFRAGDPVRWRRGSVGDSVVRVTLSRRDDPAAVDSLTLRFPGGATLAESPALAPGIYEARASGGRSLVVVNPSREWLPVRPSVGAGSVGTAAVAGDAPRLRALPWVYAVALVLLCAEWLLRRHLGLR